MTSKTTYAVVRLGSHPKVKASAYAGMPTVSVLLPNGKELVMGVAVAYALGRKLAKAAVDASQEAKRRAMQEKQRRLQCSGNGKSVVLPKGRAGDLSP